MKIKSKSTRELKRLDRPQQINPEIKIRRLQLEQLYQKQGKLQILQEKVEQSKPILKIIYEKMKKKQSNYEKQIQNLKVTMLKNSTSMKEYKLLYEQSLRVLNRNGVIARYKGHSEYLPQKQRQKQTKTQIELSLGDNNQKPQNKQNLNKNKLSTRKIDEIKMIYRGEKKQQSPTKQEIYKLYRGKLGQGKQQSILLDETRLKYSRQRSKQILSQINSDIKKIEEYKRKKRFQLSSNSSSSSNYPLNVRLKQQFLKKQQEKLLKI